VPFASIDGIGPLDELTPVAGTPEAPTEVPLWEQPMVLIAAAGALLLLVLLTAWRVASGRKKRQKLAELVVVNQAITDTTGGTAEPDKEVTSSDRRARIAELRERALALGNEDLPRLVVVFEHWFEADRDADASKRATKEAA